jgi:hypothetical protein
VFSYAFLFEEWKCSKKKRIGYRKEGEELGKRGREKKQGEKYITNINFSVLQIQFLNHEFNTRTVYMYYFSGEASPLCFK